MSTFIKGGSTSTPFGRNEFLRSTQDVKTESYTLAASTVPSRTIDGVAGQKILQPGTVLAKITSTGEAGKVGPFSAAATDGRQTAANIVGLNLTFLPWQTIERDVEVSAVYQATAVQAWCFELDATNLQIALTNTTADAMRGGKRLQINFS
jgi:Bacteriophage lambda head decoration protein D